MQRQAGSGAELQRPPGGLRLPAALLGKLRMVRPRPAPRTTVRERRMKKRASSV